MTTRPTEQNADFPITVLGARGMLGTDLTAVLRARGYTVRALDLPECDVTRQDRLEEALEGAGAVVNCAAYTNVDGAEKETETARAVNAEVPGTIGRLAAGTGAYVLHISTDFVFDGALDRPYREDDAPHPINVYGATKLEGEKRFLDSGCAGAVVRVQWTYGQAGRHFVSKFLERARAGDDLKMVADQVGSPTWTRDVGTALCDLLACRPEGILHFAARGYATRFEVAEEILALCGLRHKRLQACRTADFQSPAPRPLNSRFDCSRIEALLGGARPHWRDSLRAFLADQEAQH